MNEQERLALAKRQVGAVKGFYIHFAVFVLVMAVLLAANASVGTRWWVQWPFLGWGIGVLGHAFAVFGQSPVAVSRWEAKKIDELKRRLDAAEPDAAGKDRPDITPKAS